MGSGDHGETKAVTTAGCGLAKSGGILVSISWKCILRTPPECPPPTEQGAGGDILSEERLGSRAAIGIASQKLVSKLNRGKRMVAISRIVRERIGEAYLQESL